MPWGGSSRNWTGYWRMTRFRKSLGHLQRIPPDRFRRKLQKTAMGVFVAGISILATARWGAPWYAAAGGCLLAATIWSGEIVLAPLQMLAAVAADLLGKTKGGTDDRS